MPRVHGLVAPFGVLRVAPRLAAGFHTNPEVIAAPGLPSAGLPVGEEGSPKRGKDWATQVMNAAA